jgi:arylsulfatase A-like enzyme
MSRVPAFALTLLALGAVTVGCTRTPRPADAATPPNVIVILVDTLRADKIGTYGYKQRATTPNFDAFAKGGMVWENVISQNAWTVPSVASLFTGVDPQGHRALNFKQGEKLATDTISDQHDALAESFKGAGYTTMAWVKSTVISTSHGYSQGFDKFEIVGGKDQAWGQSAKELNDVAIPGLKAALKAGKPFYSYLHYMDPHSPYKAPEPWYSKYKGSYTGPMDGAHVPLEAAFKAGTVTAADWQYELALYDAEVEYWDTEFGRLWSELEAAGAAKNTVVVVTADHGEAFGEHQNVFHGNLYQENIRIPVVLRGPGIKAGRMAADAQSIDIPPTLAELYKLPKGKVWQGKSMAAAMGGGAGHSDVLYSEYAGHRAVLEPGTRLKLILGDGACKLYELKSDPLERTNLCASRPADVARLKAAMETRFAAAQAIGQTYGQGKAEQQTPEQCEMLKALGYLDSDQPCTPIENDDDGDKR